MQWRWCFDVGQITWGGLAIIGSGFAGNVFLRNEDRGGGRRCVGLAGRGGSHCNDI